MKKVNTEKIKDLLSQKNIKQIALANFLSLPPSGLSDSLNGKRPLSMNYIFDLADFFDVDARSLTLTNDTKQIIDNTSTTKNKEVS